MRYDDQDGRAKQRQADDRFVAALARAVVPTIPAAAPSPQVAGRFSERWLLTVLRQPDHGALSPWIKLAQRLHWTHGTEETLKRLNAPASNSMLGDRS